MRRAIATLVLVITVATVVDAAPEHARLAALCGTWDIEMTLWPRPGGPGLTTKGTSTIRPHATIQITRDIS